MANPDSRCLPLVEVELDQIQALLSPVLKGAAIAGVERVEGGLTNTLYRITPADGGVALCLRIFAAGRLSWEKERELSVGEILLANSKSSNFNSFQLGDPGRKVSLRRAEETPWRGWRIGKLLR